ncbi:MAG: SWIM zinc finger family protein [Bosea sp.]|nr:SWIM zinc finger family protein [Bosea sp. (in: a-proteobacteria)]MCP4738141.1 SWIM zinc finger family protein [Bosea sp. (in: a-proteobacteria)]
MAFDLKSIEALAPDQASLSAASKLTKRSSWMRLERNAAQNLIWGECQGSGANPYRTMADAGDHGYKCTCPSRKFPCKHSLALMWIGATAPQNFTDVETPEWVADWVGRRRKGNTPAQAPSQARSTAIEKNIGEAATQPDATEPEDPAAAQRRAAQQAKRAEDTKASNAAALDELDQWISDQLRLGLTAFVDAAGERCRRIAARLVDMKAAALAGRIDEIPSRLMALRSEERAEAAIRELGKLVLLAKAWRQSPESPDLKRMISTSETRDQILANPDAPQVTSTWEVLGEKIETRRDGLVGHSSWLLDIKAATPRFALLLDFYPASAGKRSQAFSAGERFDARLVFYPSPAPLRALVAERFGESGQSLAWPESDAARDPLAGHAARQDVAPWEADSPVLLPPGAILRDDRGEAWWQAGEHQSEIALPIAGDVPEPVFGIPLAATAGIWNGARLELLAAQTSFGRLGLS